MVLLCIGGFALQETCNVFRLDRGDGVFTVDPPAWSVELAEVIDDSPPRALRFLRQPLGENVALVQSDRQSVNGTGLGAARADLDLGEPPVFSIRSW